jgi:hypothetical protein
MPTPLERLALRASQAMATYKTGRGEAIHAVVDYGEALLEGRTRHDSDKLFGQWVAANGLDVGKPWAERIERNAAMLIARLTRENGHTGKDFADCPFTRPNDIRQWYRTKVLGIVPQKRSAKAVEKAADAIAGLAAAELPLTGPIVAEKAGVGETTALKAIALDTRERDLLGAATFTEKGKLTIEKAIALHKERLSKQFETRVNDEVRRRILAADDAARAQLKDANRKLLAFEMERGKKGVFTKTEFRQMIMLCHPDNSASDEMRSHLLDLLVKNEARLVKSDL